MKPTPVILVFASALCLGLATATADAQAVRTFVSGHGVDTNPCNLPAPCRTFQHAHDLTSNGGEIVALDAAGYGTITITKAITITVSGIAASITSNATTPNGIIVNAGPSDVVKFRGVSLYSGALSGDGIRITAAKSVTIQDCTISGFPGNGIAVVPSGATGLNVYITGSGADNSGGNGLQIAPTGSGGVSFLVTDSHFGSNTGDGLSVLGSNATGALTGTFSASVESNSLAGVEIVSVSGQSQPIVMVTNTKNVNNATGLIGNGNVHVFVDKNQISGNLGMGWQATNGGFVNSYKNNGVNGNGNDGFNGVTQITTE